MYAAYWSVLKTLLTDARAITITDFKLHCGVKVTKTALHKTDTYTNGIKDPNISPHSYTHVIFNKGAKNMLEKKQPLPQIVLVKLDIHR
jgi:hypothetical protein